MWQIFTLATVAISGLFGYMYIGNPPVDVPRSRSLDVWVIFKEEAMEVDFLIGGELTSPTLRFGIYQLVNEKSALAPHGRWRILFVRDTGTPRPRNVPLNPLDDGGIDSEILKIGLSEEQLFFLSWTNHWPEEIEAFLNGDTCYARAEQLISELKRMEGTTLTKSANKT